MHGFHDGSWQAVHAELRAIEASDLECRHAVCVVDREEGGVDALARKGVRLTPLLQLARPTRRGKW